MFKSPESLIFYKRKPPQKLFQPAKPGFQSCGWLENN
jgi:hypothetical protein